MATSPRLTRSVTLAAILALLLSACGSTGSDAATTTTAAVEITTTTEPVAETTTTEAATTTTQPATTVPEPKDEIEGGRIRLGDKSIFLDGFVGVKIPKGWAVTTARVPTRSVTPPGGENKLDPESLNRILIISPDNPRDTASFALLHYAHSDSVPDLPRFADGVIDYFGYEGDRISEGREVKIGGQPAMLYQVKPGSGDNALLLTLKSGDEFFVLISVVSDNSYSKEAAALLSSVSFAPELLHD